MPIKIFIDQGHNPKSYNTGASGNGLDEHDVTYNVGLYLYELLVNDPRFAVITSRVEPGQLLGTDNRTSLEERVRMANTWGADYFISIHANASDSETASGTEAFVYNSKSISYQFAKSMVDEIVTRLDMKDRGVKENSQFYVLKNTRMPATLMELGFLTNEDDAKKLKDDQFEFAVAMYMGLLNFFDYTSVYS